VIPVGFHAGCFHRIGELVEAQIAEMVADGEPVA
jgi:hypothetical protein